MKFVLKASSSAVFLFFGPMGCGCLKTFWNESGADSGETEGREKMGWGVTKRAASALPGSREKEALVGKVGKRLGCSFCSNWFFKAARVSSDNRDGWLLSTWEKKAG